MRGRADVCLIRTRRVMRRTRLSTNVLCRAMRSFMSVCVNRCRFIVNKCHRARAIVGVNRMCSIRHMMCHNPRVRINHTFV